MPKLSRHLLTAYSRTPLHLGSGSSVDVIDLPLMRERITNFPVIPSTSLKGVLRQHARELAAEGDLTDADVKTLFGEDGDLHQKDITAYAGCVQIQELKLLAFPVRSVAGCFAWTTCPAALRRFQRDSGRSFSIPDVPKDYVAAGSDLKGGDTVVLEEYALTPTADTLTDLVAALKPLCSDPLWTAHLGARLAVLHDENFQHFVTSCTEVVTRIAIDPTTRTVKGGDGGGGALFNQENLPCETLFYSVLTCLPPRNQVASEIDISKMLAKLLPTDPRPILQIGGDETTGLGLCDIKREELK